MRTILLLLSLALNVWMGLALARLENYHYASLLGLCPSADASPMAQVEREKCLNSQQTRTNPFWHVYYALRDQASL